MPLHEGGMDTEKESAQKANSEEENFPASLSGLKLATF